MIILEVQLGQVLFIAYLIGTCQHSAKYSNFEIYCPHKILLEMFTEIKTFLCPINCCIKNVTEFKLEYLLKHHKLFL